jgi:hypothetical protein
MRALRKQDATHMTRAPRGALLSAAVFVAAITAFVAAGPSSALLPVDSPIGEDLLLPQGPEAITRALGSGNAALPAATQIRADRALYDFTQAIGGRWSVLAWNPVTLTPRLVTGTGVSLGTDVPDRATAEELARRFVDQAEVLWGVGSSDLTVKRTYHGMSKWSVHFTQQLDGLPVIGSRLTVTMMETGRLFAFGGDLWPELQAPSQPMLSEAQAERLVHEELLQRGAAPVMLDSNDRIRTELLGILPSSATEGYLVYRIETFSQEPLGAWLVDIDARTGEIHQIQNVLRSLDFLGTVTSDNEDPGWCFGIETRPAPLMEITILDIGADTTDSDGNFTIPFEGSDPESINAEFRGPFVDVNNTVGPDAFFEDEIVPGEQFDLHWDDTNARIDERDVFHHTNKVHEFIKWIDPAWSDIDYPLPANVNIQSSCNAYWNGESINFYHEAGGCANTGRLGDVIHHEYGHGVTTFMYVTPQPPTDIHEANSDIIGNYLIDDPKMGRGFYLDDCEDGIRNSDNDLIWPDDLIGEGHHDGQILAGFLWHTRENLQLTLGDEAGHAQASHIWHFGRLLGLPMMQPEQVWWSFIADDDDGNMDNGTPSYDDMCQAAERHGFTCPEKFDHVVIHHQAYEYAPAPGEEPIEITAQIYSFDGAMNPDSLLVYYRVLGEAEFQIVGMESAGEEDMYSGLIPHYPVTTIIEYYLFAADELHNQLTDPREAPAELHQAFVVTVYDPFEEESDWTVGASGDDATQGIWEWCDPKGAKVGPNTVQPEDDATPDPGIYCWITGQFAEGYPWFSDADGQTTLLSPAYDLSGSDWVYLRFHRWFQTTGPALGVMDVDVSTVGGETWITIDHAEGFDPEPQWRPVQVNITDLFPGEIGQLHVRVVMVGEPQPSIDEGGLDDFVILAGTGLSDVGDDTGDGWTDSLNPAGVPLQLALASGNPLVGGGSATIRYGLPQAGDVRLAVLDLSGRVVQSLTDGTLPAGLHEIAWNGRDGHGRTVGSGIYFFRLVTSEGVRTQRLVMAR